MISELVVAIPSTFLDRSIFMSPAERQAFEAGTGIMHTRHWPGTTEGLALKACRELRHDPKDIDAVIFATQTPDRLCPAMAYSVAREMKLRSDIPVFDINQACGGWVYAVWLAYTLRMRAVLVVAADRIRMDGTQSKANRFIFSDAAAAAIVAPRAFVPITAAFRSDPIGEHAIECPVAGFMSMDGGAVFDFVTTQIPAMIKEFNKRECCDILAGHQPNLSLMKLVDKRSGFEGRSLNAIGQLGNMSMVSIPAALALCEEQVLRKKVLLAGYGAGWSASLMAIRWSSLPVSKIIYA